MPGEKCFCQKKMYRFDREKKQKPTETSEPQSKCRKLSERGGSGCCVVSEGWPKAYKCLFRQFQLKTDENGAHAQEQEVNCSLQRTRVNVDCGRPCVVYLLWRNAEEEQQQQRKRKRTKKETQKNKTIGFSLFGNKIHHSESCNSNLDFLIITKNSGGLAAMLQVWKEGSFDKPWAPTMGDLDLCDRGKTVAHSRRVTAEQWLWWWDWEEFSLVQGSYRYTV